MKNYFRGAKAIGFDLDGTLYRLTSDMNDRVRNKISEKILYKIPSLNSVENARRFFESKYKEIQSGSKILKRVGYSNPVKVMDECLANANVVDLIPENKKLGEIFNLLSKKYPEVYLLTSSPENLSLEKLKKIGINPNSFNYKLYSDTPNVGSKIDGTAFDFVLNNSNYPAQEHIYFGDKKESDISPAKKRRISTVSVYNEIKEADFYISNINELEELLL